jgi:putative ABC transport system ATP-binding protein
VKTVVELNDIRKIYQMGAKSTLLNVLGCLDKPTAGLYLLDGHRVDQMDDEQLAAVRRTRLGFVFQSFNLLYRSTALENVELPMVYLGIPRRERIRRARAALETVGLTDRMDHMPTQLSGGQQQRLLADEPTGNLDSRTAEEVLELLTRLQRDEKLTMIMVTHDPDIAAFAHRVVILYDGRVIYNKPSPRCGGPEIPHVKTVGLGSSQVAIGPSLPEGSA